MAWVYNVCGCDMNVWPFGKKHIILFFFPATTGDHRQAAGWAGAHSGGMER